MKDAVNDRVVREPDSFRGTGIDVDGPEIAGVGVDKINVPLPFLARSTPAKRGAHRQVPPVTLMPATVNVPPVPASRLQGLAPVRGSCRWSDCRASRTRRR